MIFLKTNQQLCEMIWEDKGSSFRSNKKLDLIIEKIKKENTYDEKQLEIIRRELAQHFYPYYHEKWTETRVSRKREKFEIIHKAWLQKVFSVEIGEFEDNNLEDIVFHEPNPTHVVPFANILSLPMETDQDDPSEECSSTADEPKNLEVRKRGRPSVAFEEGSRSTRERLSDVLAEEHITPELAKALAKRKKCPLDSAKIDINDMKTYSHMTQILALYFDLGLTCRKYESLKNHNIIISGGCNIYPCYKIVNDMRKETYPEIMTFSDIGAKADLISLLQHTIKRIMLLVNKEEWEMYRKRGLTLVGKWGMDGASGQQETRQKWENSEQENDSDDQEEDELNDDQVEEYQIVGDEEASDEIRKKKKYLSDASVFSVSFVPLQLIAGKEVIWFNPKPSSIYRCRPIEFIFQKESPELVRKTYDFYQTQIENPEGVNVKINNFTYKTKLDLKCTMIDGKTCNALTYKDSTRSCNICGVGPKYINDLNYIQENCTPNAEYYHFGLSTLHCWIRFFEYILHLSYNLDFEKGSARSVEDKLKKKERKELVQQNIRERMTMLVDIVRVGSGTTNTGE